MLLLLVVSGINMAISGNREITILGVQLNNGLASSEASYASWYDMHHFLINSVWWLIGLHFVGIMYAKK
jgi:cytochrome b561